MIAYVVVLWIGTAFWTYRDIRSRTQDGWTHAISVMLVLVFNLPGLLLYMVVRPRETLNEVYERRIEAEALMRDLPPAPATCPSCRQDVRDDFLVCPTCKTRLREACANCSRPLEVSWATCPYCTSPGPNAGGSSPSTATRRAASSPPPRPQTQAPPRPPHTGQPTRPSAPPARSESSAQALWRRIVG